LPRSSQFLINYIKKIVKPWIASHSLHSWSQLTEEVIYCAPAYDRHREPP